MNVQTELRELLKPHFTDGKGVVYELRLDAAIASINELFESVLGEQELEEEEQPDGSVMVLNQERGRNKLRKEIKDQWYKGLKNE